ncbi:MAG: pectinesterase family protein [Alistipes sp.]|nr:pectinesterase family protein [Alistipes sp.]
MKYHTLIILALVAVMAGCTGREPGAAGTVITVAADGSGDYATIAGAVSAAPDHPAAATVIYVRPGTYYEKVIVPASKTNLVLYGEDADATVLTYDDHAARDDGQGGTLGTFRTATLEVDAKDFMAVNMTVQNSFPNTRENVERLGDVQAVAVKVNSDRACFYDCRITGYQDTFLGNGSGRIYLRDCYIEGNVDFIFGSAVMVFDRCTTYANRHNSVVAAPSTLPESRYGMVFLDCDLRSMAEGEPDFNGTPFRFFHLGRPWRNRPRAVFVRCNTPETLNLEGWTTMGDNEPLLLAEYRNTGPGASPDRLARRANGGRQLTESGAGEYTLPRIFSKETHPGYHSDWLPPDKFEI